jgi:hypothetical protein
MALMLQVLAVRYAVSTPRTFSQFSAAVGAGALTWWTLRYGLRELLKLIPIVGTVTAGGRTSVLASLRRLSGVWASVCGGSSGPRCSAWQT